MIHYKKFPAHPALVVLLQEFPNYTMFPAQQSLLQLVVSEVLFHFDLGLHLVLDSETLQILTLLILGTGSLQQETQKLKELMNWKGE